LKEIRNLHLREFSGLADGHNPAAQIERKGGRHIASLLLFSYQRRQIAIAELWLLPDGWDDIVSAHDQQRASSIASHK
jgi:hypothetical protein